MIKEFLTTCVTHLKEYWMLYGLGIIAVLAIIFILKRLWKDF